MSSFLIREVDLVIAISEFDEVGYCELCPCSKAVSVAGSKSYNLERISFPARGVRQVTFQIYRSGHSF